MLFVLGIYIILAVVFMGLAVPLILQRIPPNPTYGFRVPATLNNPDVWYPANAYAGRMLFGASFIFGVFAVGFALVPGISLETYTLTCVVVLVVSIGIGMGLSFLYLARLRRSGP